MSLYQMRSHLIALHPDNYKNLECIQSSTVAIALDDSSPTDESDVCYLGSNVDSK